MTRPGFIQHLFVALVFLAVTSEAAAEDVEDSVTAVEAAAPDPGDVVGSDDTVDATSGSTDTTASGDAAGDAADGAGSGAAEAGGAAGEAADAGDAGDTGDDADDDSESLLPDGEAEMMANHPVDAATIHFKPGKGLVISSADGDFSLKTRVRLQFLYTIVKEDSEEAMHDLRMRRVRFIFAGNLFGKHNKYKFEVDALSSIPVLDFYFDFVRNRDVSVRAGQWKIASNRQRVISSGDLQLVDRSIVNAEFTLDRDIGIDIRSKDFLGKGKMRYYLNVTMGQGRNGPMFEDFGMVYLARFEYLPFGMFVDYKNTDFERSKKARLSLGWAYAFSHKAPRDKGNIGSFFADGGSANFHHAFFDAIFKLAGFSAYTEVMMRAGSRDNGSITMDDDGNPITPAAAREGVGWTIQAGYLIPRQPFEVAGRYSGIYAVGDNTSLVDNHEIALGVSWYFGRHPFKIQADVTRFWENDFGTGDVRGRVQLQGSL